MPQEIERKFLVRGDFRKDVSESHHIMQGYLCSDPRRTVRVRVLDNQGFITIKGRPQSPGHFAKYEWEKEIPVAEARELMRLCDDGIIDKIRHIVPFEGHIYEVDEFHGSNEGLFMAEIELKSEDEDFAKPVWLGDEVTFDSRYYNSYLRKHPYLSWRTEK
ncbi:MAG: CYTH domain-containing protein [Candidatus Cryptobacteroides sp.]